MESPTWPESLPNNRIKAIHELNKGQEWTNKLHEALWSPKNVESDLTSVDGVVVKILEMFQNTISIMGSCTDLHSSDHSLEEQNPKTVIPVKIKRRCTKRRKTSWTSTKVTSDLNNDGHAWRKYGQKEIINAKHQRSYYRCTYKFDQGCLATKQVQKIQDKPPNYKITYFGNHTCNNLQRAPPIILDSPADPTNYKSIVFNFETKELINKKQCAPDIRMQQELIKDVIIPSLGNLTHNQTSSCNNDPSWDPFTHVSQVPTETVSLMSSWFDHEEMVSPSTYSILDYGNEDNISSWAYSSMTSTHGYHMNNVSEKNDFNCFSF